MSDSPIDPERIAALIDGRLGERERAELLARLATSSDDDLESVADAVAVARELEGENAAAPAAVRRRPSWRRPPGSWLALAAAAVGVVLAPAIWWSTRGQDGAGDPSRFARAITQAEGGLPAGWDTHPWGATRSAPAGLTPQARAVRVGARMTDLELAARAGDPRTAELAGDVVALLADVPGSGPATTDYRAVMMADPGGPSERLTALVERARMSVTPIFDRDYLEVGAWLEAARLAASRRDSAFFASRASRDMLERVGNLRSVASPTRSYLDSVRQVISNNAARDPRTVDRVLAEALAALGSTFAP
jgi:hypothetical protein